MQDAAKIDTYHPEYDLMSSGWEKVRHCMEGQDAIHVNAKKYLERLSDEEEYDFTKRVSRTLFFNATARTIHGLVGMITAKPEIVQTSSDVDTLLSDVTMAGESFSNFIETVLTEVISVGRVGVLVDYPTTDSGHTLADAKMQGLRPLMKICRAESIINWRYSNIRNKYVLTMVCIEEEKDLSTGFGHSTEKQWRALDLWTGVCRIRVFRKDKSDRDEQVGGDVFPKMKGKTLDFIPFYFFGGATIEKPPIMDLVHANLQHFKVSADYYSGLHLTGLPTAWISGVDQEEKTYKIGGSLAWSFQDPDTKVGFLEYSGSGLGNHEKALSNIELQMAVLGARMLEPQKRGIESAEAAAIHRSGENSILASIASRASDGLSKCLKWFDQFAGGSGDGVSVGLNKDFSTAQMDPAMLSALTNSWMAGGISSRTLAYQQLIGELTPVGMTLDEVESGIKNPDIMGNFSDGTE